MRKIIHFKVGKGNCAVVETDDFVMAIDLHGNDDKSSFELVSPFFRVDNDGTDCLDVLVVTHGDKDHCGGYKEFQEKIDAGELKIGKIIHQNYNRMEEGDSDWSEDYETLQNEIDRRDSIDDAEYGDLVYAPINGDDVSTVFEGINYPDDLEFNVISPFEYNSDDDYDGNDRSLVFNFNLEQLGYMLFTGDSSSKYWQNKIIDEINNDEAKAKYLVVSHHGSYTFFGEDRDDVRTANPYPDNYEALNKIKPEELIISSCSKFPTSKDKSGDQPPHYAAYKWYHQWFEDNHGVKNKDREPHPVSWHYASEGHICFEWDGSKWEMDDDWSLEKERSKAAKNIGQKHKKQALITSGFVIPQTRYYGF